MLAAVRAASRVYVELLGHVTVKLAKQQAEALVRAGGAAHYTLHRAEDLGPAALSEYGVRAVVLRPQDPGAALAGTAAGGAE